MPRIILPNGSKYQYKLKVLYPGVKKIDKKIAIENLQLLKCIFESHNIKFQLAYGTLLGAIRNDDLIDYDEDIDLVLLEKERLKFLSLLPSLRDNGFELCRYDRRSLFSIMRNDEYIDLYFFEKYDDIFSVCSGLLLRTEYIMNSTSIYFKNDYYPIPEKYENFLIDEYGKNWQVPIKWNNYNQSKWKVFGFKIKEHIKCYIPYFILKPLISCIEANRIREMRERLIRMPTTNNGQ